VLRLAVLGYPIAHSVSPDLHQAALDTLGIEGRYEAWAVSPADLPAAVQRLRDEGYTGANVTVPHKEAVVPLVDSLDPSAAVVAADARGYDRYSGLKAMVPCVLSGVMPLSF